MAGAFGDDDDDDDFVRSGGVDDLKSPDESLFLSVDAGFVRSEREGSLNPVSGELVVFVALVFELEDGGVV